ncbi:MAG TPA: RNA polymerase sigma factor [Candidatus Acidoferrales bacterium]|nr:RNA polymerase sigma factor [Candidatus Acidoferrales bacterium]
MIFDESLRGGETLAEPNRLSHAVEAAQRGDAHGWSELFDRFHPDVHAYALARLRDLTAAEDVTQEVFVAAVHSIRSLRDRREPAVQAWFLHICRHKVMDHFRQNKRREATYFASPPAVQPDPSTIAETALESARVSRAMAELTDEQQDILVRRFVLDQSLDDVASTTGRSVGAVKSMQHRALESLRRVLDRTRAA